MLRNIVRKELILNRNTLAFAAIPYAAWFAYVLREPKVRAGEYMVMSAVMAVYYQIVFVVREDKLKTAALTCSLPVTRQLVVRARYLMGCSLSALWIGAAILVALACPWTRVPLARLVAPNTLGVAVSIVLLGTAILFPLVVRLGLIGVIAFLGGMQVLGILAFLAVDLLGPATSIHAVFRFVTASIRALHVNLGHPGFALMWTLVMLAVIVGSYRLSVCLYGRRDL
jgi:ABC-type transport system involved in multi-copper enzyme maturation permease subunit